MDSKRYILFLIGTLGLLRCGLAVGPGNWLSPACTSDSPYTFEGSGGSIDFPSNAYKEWSIFNASLEESEAKQTYLISKAGDDDYAVVGPGMLRFNEANKNDTKAWLSLGISKTGTDAKQTPLELSPKAGKIRFDNIYAKVRFVPSAELPNLSIEDGAMDLQEMYETYADRNALLDPDFDPEVDVLPKPVSAKLGVCVKDDGYFYFTRVYTAPESTANSTTGEEEAIKYEFAKSPVAYADVGGGTVIVRIEFQTYIGATEYDYPVRAYRIWVSEPGGDELCLSKGLGYRWAITEESGYTFDFDSFEDGEDCDWLFPMDQAYAIKDTTNISGIDFIQQLAFNATEGGFYSAWMATDLTIPDQNALAGYTLGAFERYAVPSASANFDAYAAWATSNNVDITEFLSTSEDTQAAFDAFLLNTSPEVLEETTVALSVTGIVTDKDTNTVTITVRGPEGCDITDIPAAKLCVVRAATLGELATAEPIECTAIPTTQQTLTVVLPDADKYPFMKACLLPK